MAGRIGRRPSCSEHKQARNIRSAFKRGRRREGTPENAILLRLPHQPAQESALVTNGLTMVRVIFLFLLPSPKFETCTVPLLTHWRAEQRSLGFTRVHSFCKLMQVSQDLLNMPLLLDPRLPAWQWQGGDPRLSINRPLMRQQNTGLRRARSTRSTRGWASPVEALPPTGPWMR